MREGRLQPENDQECSIVDYLRVIADGMPNAHPDFRALLDKGRFWTPQPLPREYELATPKQCFKNAGQLSLVHTELRYCEGYALGFVIPVHHAWLVDESGMVIDPTWRIKPRGRKNVHDPADLGYFGIVYEQGRFWEIIRQRGRWGTLFAWG